MHLAVSAWGGHGEKGCPARGGMVLDIWEHLSHFSKELIENLSSVQAI